MGKVVSLRLSEDQAERLERAARDMDQPASRAAVVLLEEALRQRDFPEIEFRDSAVGRQAYVRGTRVTAWMLRWLADAYGGDAGKVAEHLGLPVWLVEGALRYAEAYREEIETAIAENNRSPEELRKLIPNLEVVVVDASAP